MRVPPRWPCLSYMLPNGTTLLGILEKCKEKMNFAFLAALLSAAPATAKVYFQDSFENMDLWSESIMTGEKL